MPEGCVRTGPLQGKGALSRRTHGKRQLNGWGAKTMQNLMNLFKDAECFSRNEGKPVKCIKEDYRKLNDQIWGGRNLKGWKYSQRIQVGEPEWLAKECGSGRVKFTGQVLSWRSNPQTRWVRAQMRVNSESTEGQQATLKNSRHVLALWLSLQTELRGTGHETEGYQWRVIKAEENE